MKKTAKSLKPVAKQSSDPQPLGKSVSFSMPLPHVILVALLLVASFLLGTLYTKVQYLEKGAPTAAGAKSKYKTFDDAMSALAKEVKADGKKLVACMNSDETKARVDADTAQANELGINGTPAFFINGRLLGGAFPFESFKEVIDKELTGTGSDVVTAYSKSLQDAAAQGAFDPKPKVVTVKDTDSAKGPADAKVTIVEFSDFQCPYCGRAFPTVQQVLKEYDGKVRFVYKHLPLISIHPRAQKTAQAVECAKDQGKFWEFHDKLFASQTDWSSL